MGLFLPLGHQNISKVTCLDLTNNKAIPIDGKLYQISLKNKIEMRRKVVDGQKEANQICSELHASPYGASGLEWGWTSLNG